MKVVVADDHVLVRDGISHTLKNFWKNVDVLEAHDGNSLIKLVQESQDIDIVLMDLFMPDTDGFTVLERLCNDWPDIPIVVLSASENAAHMRKVLDIGAGGYVPKSLSKEVMMSALQLVLSGGVYIPPASLMETNTNNYIDEQTKQLPNLTGRQYDVLKLLIKGNTNKEIAKSLGLSEYTVKIHATAIFKVLNVSNRTQAVIEAKKMGMKED